MVEGLKGSSDGIRVGVLVKVEVPGLEIEVGDGGRQEEGVFDRSPDDGVGDSNRWRTKGVPLDVTNWPKKAKKPKTVSFLDFQSFFLPLKAFSKPFGGRTRMRQAHLGALLCKVS